MSSTDNKLVAAIKVGTKSYGFLVGDNRSTCSQCPLSGVTYRRHLHGACRAIRRLHGVGCWVPLASNEKEYYAAVLSDGICYGLTSSRCYDPCSECDIPGDCTDTNLYSVCYSLRMYFDKGGMYFKEI